MASKWLIKTITGLLASAGLASAQTSEVLPPPAPAKGAANSPTVTASAPVLPEPVESSTSSSYAEEIVPSGSRVWFDAEMLLWQIRESKIPTLIGAIPVSTLNANAGGDLPPGAITPIFGGSASRLDYDAQLGLRLMGGIWLGESADWGISGGWFQLEQESLSSVRQSFAGTVVGPVYNSLSRQSIIVPSNLDQQTSAALAEARNRLWGSELNVTRRISALFFADRLDLIVGFRQLAFDEGLDLYSSIQALPGSQAASGAAFDNLYTHNRFYGGQIGLRSSMRCNNFYANVTGKLAVGCVQQDANVNGGTLVRLAGQAPVAAVGGVLAQPTNIGSFDRNRWGLLPELTINAGYELASGIRAFVGYNFLALSNTLRPGNIIDAVDDRQIPLLRFPNPAPAGITRPAPTLDDSRFWAYGLNLGLEVNF